MKLSMNSINPGVFKVSAADTADNTNARAAIVGAGRMLAYEYARNGAMAVRAAMGQKDNEIASVMSAEKYKETNDKFQAAHLLYAARQADKMIGKVGPKDFEDFKRHGAEYYNNSLFLKTLMGIYQEVLTPILPRVYSEAVSIFADVVEVGFGETYFMTLGSNDIPVFQDSAWGASRSVPRNRFYEKNITLNPQPKTAQINAKWSQLVGNNVDFGQFFANITAGMYAKTMGLWNSTMSAAIADTSLVPANLSVTFDTQNWVKLANRLSAVNSTMISNIIAYGSYPALAQVLPQDVTGSTNVNMDAAIATLLGADYARAGYLGEYMAVRLMPLVDVVIPGTQNTTVDTMLSDSTIYMMAGSSRKPLTIGYNEATPIQLEVDPSKAGDMEMAINITIAMDSVAVFEDHIGVVTI
jgi:hypothetical protein